MPFSALKYPAWNQVHLLTDSKYGKAGQVINAHIMRGKQLAEVPHTVRISDLDQAFTGPLLH